MFEATLDNTLVHQKDELRSKIVSGQLAEAVTCLVFVQELWIEADYHFWNTPWCWPKSWLCSIPTK
jgi:hypothetical protein